MSQGKDTTRVPLKLVAPPGKRGALLKRSESEDAPRAPDAETTGAESDTTGAESDTTGAESDTTGADGEKSGGERGARYSAYDVKQLVEECNGLLVAIGQRGAVVDQQRVRSVAESFAAIRLLILAGICTEEEAQGEVYAAMRGVLARTLQSVEEARLKAQAAQQGPVTVKRPPLIVAKH